MENRGTAPLPPGFNMTVREILQKFLQVEGKGGGIGRGKSHGRGTCAQSDTGLGTQADNAA